MKKTFTTRFCAMLLVMLTAISVTLAIVPVAYATSYPKAQNYVADDAGLLSEETIRQIKKINDGLYTDTKTVIAVCTVNNTGEADIAAYSRSLFTEWKLGDGILILISGDDKNYYFVPSVGVEDILTGEVLASIRDEYFESEFNSGNIDRAVQKTVVKLRSVLLDGIKSRKAAAADTADTTGTAADDTGAKTTTAGSIIVGILRTILIIAIVLVVLFIVVFAIGLYNEDVGAILRKYIFSHFNKRVQPEPDYLDERLYGDRRQQVRRQQNGHPYPQNARDRQYNQYNGQNYNDGGRYPVHYNGGQGRPYPQQNQRQNGQGGYGYNNGYGGNNQYGRMPQNGQYGQYNQYNQNGQYGQYAQYNQNNQYSQNNQYGGYQQNGQNNQYSQHGQNGQYRGMRQPQQNGYGQRQQNPQNQNGQMGRRGSSQPEEDYEATRQFNIPRG